MNMRNQHSIKMQNNKNTYGRQFYAFGQDLPSALELLELATNDTFGNWLHAFG